MFKRPQCFSNFSFALKNISVIKLLVSRNPLRNSIYCYELVKYLLHHVEKPRATLA